MESSAHHRVFIAGSTGYLGRALVPRLIERGHEVCGLCRRGSQHRLPAGCGIAIGDALDAASYASQVAPADTFLHLVGVSHPSPWKADQFRAVDLRSIQASVSAAKQAQVRHFIYVSVAHPAPIMKSYISVRQECESLLRASGLVVTVLRPWYVLGPGHRWPYVLLPVYWVASGCRRATMEHSV